MKKLIMLITVLSFVFVQGHAQERTVESIDWDKMPGNIALDLEKITLGLENLTINLSDMGIDLSDIKVDANSLKELEDMKMYTYNLETQQETKAEQRAEPQVYAYSYSTNESNQSNKASSFEDIGNISGVEVVYITKALLGMMPNMDMPGVNVGKVAGKLESLQIYSTEEKGPAILLKRTINKLIQLGNYETLMLVKDSDSKTAFYLKSEGKDKKSELLMVTEDGSDVSIIRMLGNFTIQDIQSLTKGQSLKK